MDEVLTDRLRLRAWAPGDLDPYARIVADAEVMAYMGTGPVGRDVAAQQIEHFGALYAAQGTPQWAAEDRATGELAGRIGLFHHPDWPLDPENVEVGWMLARARWGEGLATEGARAAIGYAWDRLPTPRVISLTVPDNVRSRAVMERLGMTERGRRRWRGYQHVWYALDRPASASADEPRGPEVLPGPGGTRARRAVFGTAAGHASGSGVCAPPREALPRWG